MKQILIQSKGIVECVLVDDEDFHTANQYRWSIATHHGLKYAVHTSAYRIDSSLPWKAPGNRKSVSLYLHRHLLKNPECHVDHHNGNTLDNTRNNLRLATHTENMRNRFKHKNKKYKGPTYTQVPNQAIEDLVNKKIIVAH